MYEDIHYERPFLNQVVARIDFVAPIPGVEKALSPKFGKILSDHFPIVEPPQDAFSFEMKFPTGEQHKTLFKQWNFYGKERERQLSVASAFMFVVYNKYASYEDMRDNFAAVVTALEQHYPDTRVGRFGLRYINIIEIDGVSPVTGWNEYISPVLISSTPFFDSSKLTRLVHIAEMKCGDLNLRFQFGLPNPDYPVPIKRPSFVLDFDAHIQSAHELSISLQHMDRAHECSQDLFEQSITDKLRERMNA